MGNILDLARKHSQMIIGQGGFETEITFQASPAIGSATAIVTGTAISHHTSVDTEGFTVRSLNNSITVHVQSLIDAGYPTRNAAGEIILKNNLVTWADVTGVEKTYVIEKALPDNTLGCIPLILGKYVSD